MSSKRKPKPQAHGNPGVPISELPTPHSEPQNPLICEEMQGNASDSDFSALSPRQRRALPIIAASLSNAQAARDVGVHESTLYRWLENPEFRNELDSLRREASELAVTEIQSAMLQAVSVVIDATRSENEAIRLRAARELLQLGLRIGEIEKLRHDIRSMEELLPLWAAHYRTR